MFLDSNIRIEKIRHFGAKGKSLFIEFKKVDFTFYGLSLYNWTSSANLKGDKLYKILYTPLEKTMKDKRVVFIHEIVNM